MAETEQTLDMRGRPCPEPVIETRKALEQPSLLALEVLVDNESALENVSRTGRNLGCEVDVTVTAKGDFQVRLIRSEVQARAARDSPLCTTIEKVVVLIPSDRFGDGDPDLGRALIQAFIGTLKSITPRPRTLIFLNSGIRLVCESEKVIQEVRALAQSDCRVLVCGTCLDFYHLDKKLQVGQVSNMLEIATELANASNVIRP